MSEQEEQTIAGRLAAGFVAFIVTGVVLLCFLFITWPRAARARYYDFRALDNFDLWAPATCIFAFVLGVAFGNRMFGSFRLKDRHKSDSSSVFVLLVALSAAGFWHYFN